jgi:hypothetical protein
MFGRAEWCDHVHDPHADWRSEQSGEQVAVHERTEVAEDRRDLD